MAVAVYTTSNCGGKQRGKGICRGAMGQMRGVEEKKVNHDPSKNIWATQIDEFGGVLNRRESRVGRIIG